MLPRNDHLRGHKVHLGRWEGGKERGEEEERSEEGRRIRGGEVGRICGGGWKERGGERERERGESMCIKTCPHPCDVYSTVPRLAPKLWWPGNGVTGRGVAPHLVQHQHQLLPEVLHYQPVESWGEVEGLHGYGGAWV